MSGGSLRGGCHSFICGNAMPQAEAHQSSSADTFEQSHFEKCTLNPKPQTLEQSHFKKCTLNPKPQTLEQSQECTGESRALDCYLFHGDAKPVGDHLHDSDVCLLVCGAVRDGDGDGDGDTDTDSLSLSLPLCLLEREREIKIYIFIFREREREIQRVRERE